MDAKRFLGLLDMIDGGGAGQSGSKFEGGPLSGLLNALGIKPKGANEMAQPVAPVQPQAPMPMPSPAPAMAPPAMPDVSTQPLPPSMQELLAALSSAPRGPYAPAQAPQAYPSLQEITAMMEAERMKRLYGGMR
jgi:hypothetical protein